MGAVTAAVLGAAVIGAISADRQAKKAEKSAKEAMTLQKISPSPTKITGGASDEIRRRQRSRVSGRGKTIVTGDLTPQQVEKKTLLGR